MAKGKQSPAAHQPKEGKLDWMIRDSREILKVFWCVANFRSYSRKILRLSDVTIYTETDQCFFYPFVPTNFTASPSSFK